MTLWAGFWEETCPERQGLTHAHWNKCSTEHTNPQHGIGQCCHCLAYANPAAHGSMVQQPVEIPSFDIAARLRSMGLHPPTDDDVDTEPLVPVMPVSMSTVRFLAHPNDPDAQEFHPIGTRFMAHSHLIVEDHPHNIKQKMGAHIDRWHFRV